MEGRIGGLSTYGVDLDFHDRVPECPVVRAGVPVGPMTEHIGDGGLEVPAGTLEVPGRVLRGVGGVAMITESRTAREEQPPKEGQPAVPWEGSERDLHAS